MALSQAVSKRNLPFTHAQLPLAAGDGFCIRSTWEKTAADTLYDSGAVNRLSSDVMADHKQSGWGREMGKEVLEHYTEVKSIVVKV